MDPQSGQRDFAGIAPNYSAVLPAAGAFTAQDYTPIPSGFPKRIGVIAVYAADAAAAPNGQCRCRFQWSLKGAIDVYESLIDGGTVTVSGSFGQVPEYAMEILSPKVAANATLKWRLISLEVPQTAVGFRVLAAEIGDTAHPGTLTAAVFTSND